MKHLLGFYFLLLIIGGQCFSRFIAPSVHIGTHSLERFVIRNPTSLSSVSFDTIGGYIYSGDRRDVRLFWTRPPFSILSKCLSNGYLLLLSLYGLAVALKTISAARGFITGKGDVSTIKPHSNTTGITKTLSHNSHDGLLLLECDICGTLIRPRKGQDVKTKSNFHCPYCGAASHHFQAVDEPDT
jgi:hypothetical protein